MFIPVKYLTKINKSLKFSQNTVVKYQTITLNVLKFFIFDVMIIWPLAVFCQSLVPVSLENLDYKYHI